MKAVILGLCLALTACAVRPLDSPSETPALAKQPLPIDHRVVNDNWSVDCLDVVVSGFRDCYAAARGQAMTAAGKPYGGSSKSISVRFLGDYGPIVFIAGHDFPGRKPMVRVDEHPAYMVSDDGGVTPHRPDPELVELMMSGKVIRASYDEWPTGLEYIYVDIEGFAEAWDRLQYLMESGHTAVSADQ